MHIAYEYEQRRIVDNVILKISRKSVSIDFCLIVSYTKRIKPRIHKLICDTDIFAWDQKLINQISFRYSFFLIISDIDIITVKRTLLSIDIIVKDKSKECFSLKLNLKLIDIIT